MTAPPPPPGATASSTPSTASTSPTPTGGWRTATPPRSSEWVAAQNARTRQALDARPDRGWWHERLVALMQLPVVMAVQVRGDHLFCLERPAGAEQFLLTRRSAADPDAAPVVLVDPAVGTADAANAVDWFEASPDGALVAVGTSEGGTEDSVLRVLDDGRRPRPRRGHPQHPGLQRGLGARRLGLRLHPLPRGRPVPPHRAPPPPRRPLGGRPGRCGPSTPTRRPGRASTLSPDGALAARPRAGRLGPGRRPPARPGDRHVDDGRRGRRGHLGVPASPPTATPSSGSPRSMRRGAGSCAVPLDAVPPTPADWTTVVAEGDAVIVRPAGVGRRAARRRHDRGPSTRVRRYDADGRSLGPVDGLRRRGRRRRAVGRPLRRTGVRRRRLVRRADVGVARRRRRRRPRAGRRPARRRRASCPTSPSARSTYPSLDGTPIGLFLIHRADVVPGPDVPAILNGYGGFAISETPVWSPQIAAVVRGRRHVRHRRPARRAGGGRGVAPRRAPGAQAERVRRLPRRRRLARRSAATPAATAWPSTAAPTAACSSAWR